MHSGIVCFLLYQSKTLYALQQTCAIVYQEANQVILKMPNLSINLRHFYYDYKYIKLILLIGLINIYIFYESFAVVEKTREIAPTDGSAPSPLPTRYLLEQYEGYAVHVRYEHLWHEPLPYRRLNRLQPTSTSAQAKVTQPSSPSSDELMQRDPMFSPESTKRLPNCPLMDLSQTPIEFSDCHDDSGTPETIFIEDLNEFDEFLFAVRVVLSSIPFVFCLCFYLYYSRTIPVHDVEAQNEFEDMEMLPMEVLE